MNYKYNIVYKTTNLINNKIYIGVHETDNLEDGYLGTGRMITRAIKKYGRKNFKREILFIFDRQDEAYEKEKELVTESFINNPNTYNLAMGGWGGREFTSKQKQILSEKFKGKNNPMYNKKGKNHHCYGKKHSEERCKQASIRRIGKETFEKRMEDIKNCEKKYGWMAELSKKWGVTNDRGFLFIKRFYPDYEKRGLLGKKQCKQCSKELADRRSTICAECHSENMRNPKLVKLTTNELNDLFWSKPLSEICKIYGCIPTTLKGLAKRKNIQLPERGYWGKKENLQKRK